MPHSLRKEKPPFGGWADRNVCPIILVTIRCLFTAPIAKTVGLRYVEHVADGFRRYKGPAGTIMSMTRRKRLQHAEKYFAMALDFMELDYYEDAAYYFRKSIKMYPTAEAYTYLGWAHSLIGEYDQAIDYCKVAISLDPDYGNPYNDIGSYLMDQGQIDEAIPYLRRATRSRRYDPKYYAHFNLGRAWERKHDFERAVSEYKRALDLNPDYQPAKDAYYKLLRMMN